MFQRDIDDPQLGAVLNRVCQMALGVQRLMGTTLAVSVTGIAGPSGRTRNPLNGVVRSFNASGYSCSCHAL